MDTLSYVSLFEGLAFLCLFVYIIYRIHLIPGIIAEKKEHPQKEAIHICAWCGLVLFPLWLVALIWAHSKPIKFETSMDKQDLEEILYEIIPKKTGSPSKEDE